MEDKVIVLHGFTEEEAVTAMRMLSSGMSSVKGAAFAMTTATNLEWKLADLLEHVLEEHAAMKKAK